MRSRVSLIGIKSSQKITTVKCTNIIYTTIRTKVYYWPYFIEREKVQYGECNKSAPDFVYRLQLIQMHLGHTYPLHTKNTQNTHTTNDIFEYKRSRCLDFSHGSRMQVYFNWPNFIYVTQFLYARDILYGELCKQFVSYLSSWVDVQNVKQKKLLIEFFGWIQC